MGHAIVMGKIEMILNFNHRMVNIALAISTTVMLVILIVCYATFGWAVDYKPNGNLVVDTNNSGGVCAPNSPSNTCGPCYSLESRCGNSDLSKRYCLATTTCSASQLNEAFNYTNVTGISCDFSLEESKCDNGTTDLAGDAKKAADAMAGLGSMVVIFLFINLCINIYIAIVGIVLAALSWLFLMSGWGHYADKKGGIASGSADYGASFAFVILVWLALFPYIFFWVVLWNQVAAPTDDCEGKGPGGVQEDPNAQEPNAGEYPSAAATVPPPTRERAHSNVDDTPADDAPVYDSSAAHQEPVAKGADTVQHENPVEGIENV